LGNSPLKGKMFISFNKTLMIQLLIVCVAGSFLSGCGKKAPPRPPRLIALPAVKDLSKSIKENALTLTWRSQAAKESSRSDLAGYYVYRSKRQLPGNDCQDCPLVFQRVAKILIGRQHSKGTTDNLMSYRETLQRGYQYIYKVVAFADGGAIGRDSNIIDFKY
jgi:hypothetical protein